MNSKIYNNKDLNKYKYAILSYDYEDFMYYIESMHFDDEMAKKRLNYLKRQEEIFFNKSQGYAIGYMLVNTNDDKIKKCFNFGGEE